MSRAAPVSAPPPAADSEQAARAATRSNNQARAVAMISVAVSIALFAVKLWVATRADSVAVLAEALNSLMDAVSSLVVVAVLAYASKPPDQRHPFGHGRAELIGSVIVGTLVAAVGLTFLLESIERLANGRRATFDLTAGLVIGGSALVKELLAQISFRVGRRTGARSLIADAWHHRSDVAAAALVVLAMLISSRAWWVDGVAGCAISLFIIGVGIAHTRGTMSDLLGQEVEEEVVANVRRIAGDTVQHEVDPHHLHLHDYGDHRELTFHIRLPPTMQLEEAHAIADRLEAAMRGELGLETTVHTEPYSPRAD